MSKNRKLAYLALLATAIIWGFSPPIIKYTLGFISPTVFLFYRFLFTAIVLLIPLSVKLLKERPSLSTFFYYVWIGFIGTPLTLFLLFNGIQRTTAIDASLISIISPILVIAGGVFFLKENVSKAEKIGIIVTLAGTVFTLLQPIFEYQNSVGKNILGNVLVLAGTISWAVFTLLVKKQSKKLDPFILSSLSFFTGLLIAFFFLVITQNLNFNKQINTFVLHPTAFLGVISMAIFASVIAYSTYTYGVSKIEASEATVFTYLQPVFAIPLSIIFLKERVSVAFWIGAILITLGVFICEFRFKKSKTN